MQRVVGRLARAPGRPWPSGHGPVFGRSRGIIRDHDRRTGGLQGSDPLASAGSESLTNPQKLRRNPARARPGFQDRRLRPLGHLSARKSVPAVRTLSSRNRASTPRRARGLPDPPTSLRIAVEIPEVRGAPDRLVASSGDRVLLEPPMPPRWTKPSTSAEQRYVPCGHGDGRDADGSVARCPALQRATALTPGPARTYAPSAVRRRRALAGTEIAGASTPSLPDDQQRIARSRSTIAVASRSPAESSAVAGLLLPGEQPDDAGRAKSRIIGDRDAATLAEQDWSHGPAGAPPGDLYA